MRSGLASLGGLFFCLCGGEQRVPACGEGLRDRARRCEVCGAIDFLKRSWRDGEASLRRGLRASGHVHEALRHGVMPAACEGVQGAIHIAEGLMGEAQVAPCA